jgi:hypothetical protein|nr:MAG TPA: protein of unknown function (DUF4907) [Caudoviricetes sp.]
MEIVLNCGDKINIPDGCKAEIKDGVITIEREVKEFKDGDILAYVGITDNTSTFIYKGQDENGSHKYYAGLNVDKRLSISNDDARWGKEALRPATEEETQFLFDKMAEQNLRWNAEEKKIEDIRLRVMEGDAYYYINSICNVSAVYDERVSIDDKQFLSYNYFKTKEQAEKAAELVKDTLKKFHEENS